MQIVGDRNICRTNIESLPDVLLFDILVRLPADDLYERARVVCRRWSQIICSDAFVNTHFHHSCYGLLLFAYGSMNMNPIYVSATKEGRIEISLLSFKRRSRAWCSCNGLVLESSMKTGSQYIFNPATKQAFLLSPFEFDSNVDGLCAASSTEYKLVQSQNTRGHHLAVLTTGVDSSWRHVEIEHLPNDVRRLFHYAPLITEGFMHWTRGSEKVLTMNVETEIIRETNPPLPQAFMKYKKYYLSTGKYLTLLIRHEDLMWEVWEMKSAETGEWRKHGYNIKFEDQQLQQFDKDGYHHHHNHRHRVSPFGWVKYPEICAFRVSCSRTLIFYNLATHEIISTRTLPGSTDDYKVLQHRNTLVWLSP
ncbi:hypothetical protein C2S52_006976 [Perilla frutescens var. hirtella]|nr:hypothetical protein C2S52_006976 [Perilla frutescens var. hirtella]